ncbi:MAG: acetolactate synthase large subunit, partial [Ascidiaceihabitans sp.]
KYAESYGATGHRIEATDDLVPTINAAFKAGGVHLIDLPVDYSDNQKVLIDELAEKACLL